MIELDAEKTNQPRIADRQADRIELQLNLMRTAGQQHENWSTITEVGNFSTKF